MLKTVIEFMDGRIQEIGSRHITRTDKESMVFRVLLEKGEVEFPLCNIRSIHSLTVPDDTTTDPYHKNFGIPPVMDAEKDQKKKSEWEFNIPFFNRGEKK